MTYMFDARFHRQLAGLSSMVTVAVSRQLTRAMAQIVSPTWEQVVFKALHELDAAEADSPEAITRWQKLPLQVRTWVVASIVWTCVLTYLMALSLQHQTEAAALRDATGLDPAELSAAVACLAGMVYRHFALEDEA